MSWVTPAGMGSQAQLLADAREEICGGNTDFISAVDKGGVVRAVHLTDSHDT